MKARFNHTRPVRPGFRLRRPTTTTTRRPTASAATATSRPTRMKMAKPIVSMRPFRKFLSRTTTLKPIESQATSKPTKSTTRTPLFARRPIVTTPRTLDDSDHESTVAEEATNLRDLAVALNVIQNAPVPNESNKHAVMERPATTPRSWTQDHQRLQEWAQLGDDGGPSSSTRQKIEALRTTSRPPSTTRYHTSNAPSATAAPNRHPPFYRVSSPSIPLRPQSLDEDFYLTGTSLPAHSKVLLHADGVIECLDQGSFPHPVSCRKFISCSKMDNAKILGWEYTCPRNLSFDPIGGMCNWSAGLGCDEK